LWARRSWFAIRGRRLLVQEVFLPALVGASAT
jgi:chorismate-pyruvate lyase